MLSTNNSNVYLNADVAPQPVTAIRSARHTFEVENHNSWSAEVLDSQVSVVSGAGVELKDASGAVCARWSPGRLGLIRTNSASNPVPTPVQKCAGTFSSGEDIEVTITFRRAPTPDCALPSAAIPLTLTVSVSIR